MENAVKKYIQRFWDGRFSGLRILISVFSSFVIIILIMRGEISELEFKHENISKTQTYIDNLKKNPKRLLFMQKHILSSSQEAPLHFQKTLDELAKKYKINVTKKNEKTDIFTDAISKNSYEIEAIAWHDSDVFQLVNSIQHNSAGNGLVSITKLHISKISDINLKSQAIKMEMVCNIYFVK